MTYRITVPGVLLLLLLLPGLAVGHKVNLFAYAEAGQIYVEGYFPDGRSVSNGKVKVFDSADQLLLEGKTDPDGLFNFPIPKTKDLSIVLDAGMGHKTTFTLKKSEIKPER